MRESSGFQKGKQDFWKRGTGSVWKDPAQNSRIVDSKIHNSQSLVGRQIRFRIRAALVEWWCLQNRSRCLTPGVEERCLNYLSEHSMTFSFNRDFKLE